MTRDPLVVELPGLLRVLALLILLTGTMCVLLRRDQPVSAGLFAAAVGLWLAIAAPHLQRLPARLSSVPVQTWTTTTTAVSVLMLLSGLAVQRSARRSRGEEPQ